MSYRLLHALICSIIFFEPACLVLPPPNDGELGVLLSARGYSSASFKRSSTGHPMVRAQINGYPVTLILDTGSPTTVLDKERSARLGLVPMGRKLNAASIGSSKVATDVAELREFLIAGVLLRNYGTAIMDLSIVNAGVPPEDAADGIVGADVLNRCKALIDYSSSTLYLLNKE